MTKTYYDTGRITCKRSPSSVVPYNDNITVNFDEPVKCSIAFATHGISIKTGFKRSAKKARKLDKIYIDGILFIKKIPMIKILERRSSFQRKGGEYIRELVNTSQFIINADCKIEFNLNKTLLVCK